MTGQPHGATGPASGVPRQADAARQIAEVEDRSASVALSEGIEELDAPAVASGPVDLPKVARAALEAETRYLAARRKYEAKIGELDDREERVREEEKELAARRAELDNGEAELARRDAELALLESGLKVREDDVKAKEIDALAGFVALAERERARSLASLEAEVEAARTRLDEYSRKLEKERAKADASREAAAAEHEARVVELRKQIRELEMRARVEREILEEDEEREDVAARYRESKRVEALEGKIRDLEERLEAARATQDELYAQVRARDESLRALGHKDPEEVKREIDQLLREGAELRAKLAASVSAEERTRLEAAARGLDESEAARARLAQENVELRASLARITIAATELETLRDHNDALESSRALLQEALKELAAQVDERIRRADESSPFPQCRAMDADPARQEPRRMARLTVDLPAFVDDLRHRVAIDPRTEKVLYYTERDVRCFVAGMAMSRLHLLQGISGTGKTSLPQAVARALGAGSRLIEVQAGWRDRHDLIGHFNEFERRFYESEFLQALYEAQCPAFRDRPYIVVLDEMNLSHPEQYFADLLSALEQDRPLQKLHLMTSGVEPAPRLLEEGRTLPVPGNVWFVGTANHDETTMGFADKTYDRAHVMELPRHPTDFEPREMPERDPIPLRALTDAFEKAKSTHERDALRANRFLEDELGDVLAERFGIGWGNRLERQLGDFVPVVVAGGGTLGEALDHVVATKLLRRVRDRHDNRLDDLNVLRAALSNAWIRLKDGSTPERSLEIVDRERHRIEAG